MTRLLGILLALLLAIPAVQAGGPQVQPAPASMAMHHMAGHEHHMMMQPEHRSDAPAHSHAVHHDCLGCIAPIDIELYRPAASPQRTVTQRDRPADMAYTLTPLSAPEPPPPRALV